MTLQLGCNIMAILGFILGNICFVMTIWDRAKGHGRLAAAIDAATSSDREVSKMLQAQSVAMEGFARGMQAQGQGLQDVAAGFRDFAAEQKRTNEELWTAIQVQSARVNRVVEGQRTAEGDYERGQAA